MLEMIRSEDLGVCVASPRHKVLLRFGESIVYAVLLGFMSGVCSYVL